MFIMRRLLASMKGYSATLRDSPLHKRGMKRVPFHLVRAIPALPNVSIFIAAFTSLSWLVLHSGHNQDLSDNVRLSFMCPQTWQRLDDGNHRSISMIRQPYQLPLYLSILTNIFHPLSDIDFARV